MVVEQDQVKIKGKLKKRWLLETEVIFFLISVEFSLVLYYNHSETVRMVYPEKAQEKRDRNEISKYCKRKQRQLYLCRSREYPYPGGCRHQQ